MLQGQQVNPHRYVRRINKGGVWHYVYADAPKKRIEPAAEGLKEFKVVICHQKPTPILVHPDTSMIVFGPPQTVGKKFFVNTKESKGYFALAKRVDGSGTAIYMYPESYVKEIKTKKAAKFLKGSDALKLIDSTASELMSRQNHIDQQYGLAMWLNNHSGLRIGAHENAASVDAVERRAIINRARAENWADAAKDAALEEARKPTFGLLTSHIGHIKLNPQTHVAQWSLRSKGGKMITGNNVAVHLPDLQYFTLSRLMNMKSDEDKLFPDVHYKHLWAYYDSYGITPHIARGVLAEEMLGALRKSFAKTDGESSEVAYRRFKKAVQTNISDKLGHTADMTLKAYISDTTRAGLDEAFKHTQTNITESAASDGLEALAHMIVWLEVGPGNAVI